MSEVKVEQLTTPVAPRRQIRRRGQLGAAAVCLALALSACGGGSSPAHHASSGSSSQGTGSGSSAQATSPGSKSGGSAQPNGVAAKPPDDIVTAAIGAVDQLHSVHVAGSVVDNGIPVRLDLRLLRGQGGEGVVSENGLAFRLIAIGHSLYIQGSDAFWSHFGGARAVKVFHGKWLKAPDAGQFASIGALTSVPRLFSQLLSRHGTLSKGQRTTVDGQPAIGVVDRSRGGTLFVATTGKPFPLRLVKGGKSGGRMSFSGFNQPVKLTAPAKTIGFPKTG